MTNAFALATLLALGFAPGCARKATAVPPPQVPTSAAPSSADGGWPAVPLTGKGVITPSDVKLEPGPKAAEQQSSGLTNTTATPNAN